jgi:hypothetical protein
MGLIDAPCGVVQAMVARLSEAQVAALASLADVPARR